MARHPEQQARPLRSGGANLDCVQETLGLAALVRALARAGFLDGNLDAIVQLFDPCRQQLTVTKTHESLIVLVDSTY